MMLTFKQQFLVYHYLFISNAYISFIFFFTNSFSPPPPTRLLSYQTSKIQGLIEINGMMGVVD